MNDIPKACKINLGEHESGPDAEVILYQGYQTGEDLIDLKGKATDGW